ncbi:MAG: kelch repeat-containing protein [Woeseiaceae bacterium]|nr:kelch repeat-containing protein [Woeseiaceae bacterium]
MRLTRHTATPGILLASLVISVGCTTAPQSDGEPSPGPRYGHEMVYDEAREEVILFGGFGPDGVPKGDTWAWNGAAWRRVAETGPSPRKWPAAAYDSRRGLVVLHGGRDGVGRSGPSLSDTWIWNGREWQQASVNGPTPRDHHRAAYDEARDRVVLFGGWNGESLENDTWEWDGAEWQRVANDGPGPRAPFGMAYHESLESVVIAGGQDLNGAFDDIWAWNGSAWHRVDSAVPSARGFHAMTSVPGTESVVVFGGRNGDELLNDLWEWNGRQWRRISSDGPVRRGIYASAYDQRRGELIVHGSGDRVGNSWILESETWAWKAGQGWRLLSPAIDQTVEER